MANRYVRLYENGPERAVAGYSGSAYPTGAEFEALSADLQAAGFQIIRLSDDEYPNGTVSKGHVEIRPPIPEERLHEIGGIIMHYVDEYHNSKYFIDNTEELPGTAYGPGKVILQE